MSYIGIAPSTAAFPYDQFSGNGTTTAFTMSYAPASTTSMVVCISGVVQNPSTYGISGLTLTFSAAPPTGTNNIGVLYLGIPATSVTTPGNTAYLTTTSFTATAGQTTFTPSGSYQVGFINVIRNGSQLAPADFTATNGTTVVLNNACVAGDVVVTQGYTLSSIANALPSTGGTVTGATTFNNQVTINGGSASGYTGYKNRIINGGMVIDQRNNGAAVSLNNNLAYTLDRWVCDSRGATGNGVISFQRSSVAPVGFINSLSATLTTPRTSAAATDVFAIYTKVEGYNAADLAWGTASAATVTFSFWVRSSITGTYSGAIENASQARSYPFSYTISSANTWEQKSITIPGDTSGTWPTDNTQNNFVMFNLGCGSNYLGAANTWASATYIGTTGSTNWATGATSSTFYITGVQLERGSNATSFEFRDYGRELIMCQRYYYKQQAVSTASLFGTGFNNAATNAVLLVSFPVQMRTNPSALEQTGTAANYSVYYQGGSALACSSVPIFNTGDVWSASVLFTVASGLTSGQASMARANNVAAYLAWSAEL